MIKPNQKTIVVIGNGMVGHRFCEKIVEYDELKQYKIVTFCEESRAAYDRVGLTSFFAHRDAEKLMIARLDWYKENHIDIHVGDRAGNIDRKKKIVTSDKGVSIPYDHVVLATGSYPFVPPVDGIQQRGVFVYRTIDDLEKIIEYGKTAKRCAVIGGGLLGLEAAKAAYDLGLETHVVEFAPRLMPRQIDTEGSEILVNKIESLGVKVHLGKATKLVRGSGTVEGMDFADGDSLDVDMIIVSAGIRPRDEVARECEIEVGPRGGIVVDDHLLTSDPNIHAIGECALHNGMIYGLIAPGWDMADIAARNLCGEPTTFGGTDLSTKLKLMGVDVASFGQYELPAEESTPLTFRDPFDGIYKKLFFSLDGKKLLGGILVGDASDFGTLSIMAKSDADLPCRPQELIVGQSGGLTMGGVDSMPDDAQICSCNNVLKRDICEAIEEKDLTTSGTSQIMYQSGNRLRWLYAAGYRLVACRAEKSGQVSQYKHVRTLRYVSHGTVCHCQSEESHFVRRDYQESRERKWLRDMQASGRFHVGNAVQRKYHAARISDAARHERSLPRQHAARRFVLSDTSRSRRRDYARKADRAWRDGQRSMGSTPRSQARSASTCLGLNYKTCPPSGRSWSTPALKAGTHTAKHYVP